MCMTRRRPHRGPSSSLNTVHMHVPRRTAVSESECTVADYMRHAQDQSLGAAPCAAAQRWRAAVSEGERTIAPSTLTLPSEDKDDGSHPPTVTVSDALKDPWCESDAPAAARMLSSRDLPHPYASCCPSLRPSPHRLSSMPMCCLFFCLFRRCRQACTRPR